MKYKSIKPLIFFILLALLLNASPISTADSQAANPDSRTSPKDNTIVARVYFAGLDDLNRLAASLDVWKVHHQTGYLVAQITPAQSTALQQAGYLVQVDTEKTARLAGASLSPPDQLGGIPGYPCYRTVEETYASLSQLAASQPGMADWVDIGDSWEKVQPGGAEGYDLYALVLTNKAIPGPKPAFFLMAAIHAREYATAELAARFAEKLAGDYGSDPDITWLLDYFAVHILPHSNPDGRKLAETGVYWRKNVDNDDGCIFSSYWGADLNRNSSFHWGGVGANGDPCSEIYRGPAAASEPEVQAIQDYVSAIFPDQRGPEDGEAALLESQGVFISLHSYWPLVLFPWGWTANPAPNDAQLETLGRKFGHFTGYSVCQSGEDGCIYQTSGTTDDWAYGELGLAAYTFEVGTEFFESCMAFENSVLPDNLPALLYAFKAARRPYQAPAGPETLALSLSLDTVAPGLPVQLAAQADDTRYNSNGWGDEPVQNIVSARFSLDLPSWETGAQTHPFEPSDGAFDEAVENLQATIDTTGLSAGRHLVFVESQDAAGNWGVPSALLLTVQRDYDLSLAPQASAGSGYPGNLVTYSLEITNSGILTDTYTVSLGEHNWETSVDIPEGPVPPGDSRLVTISVAIPPEAPDQASETTQLVIASQGEAGVSASASLQTISRWRRLYFPLMRR